LRYLTSLPTAVAIYIKKSQLFDLKSISSTLMR